MLEDAVPTVGRVLVDGTDTVITAGVIPRLPLGRGAPMTLRSTGRAGTAAFAPHRTAEGGLIRHQPIDEERPAMA